MFRKVACEKVSRSPIAGELRGVVLGNGIVFYLQYLNGRAVARLELDDVVVLLVPTPSKQAL